MMKYLETANELTQGLNSLFASLTLGKFLKWVFSIIVILAAGLFVYQNYLSSSFYYDKVDRNLQIIEKVKELSLSDSMINKTADQKLLELLNDLDVPNKNYLSLENVDLRISESIGTSLLKILGALILPILIIFSVRSKPDKTNAITGAVLFMVVFGAIAVFIPVIINVWVNFFLILFMELLVLLPFMIKNKKNKLPSVE